MLQKSIHLMESVANEPLFNKGGCAPKAARGHHSSNHCGASTSKSRLKLKPTLEQLYQNTFYIAPVDDERMHFANKSQHQVFDLSATASPLAVLLLFWFTAI
jgi:hypothetical protein